MALAVDVRGLWRGLAVMILALLVGHLVGMVFIYGFDHDYVFGLVPFFSLDGEGNLPAWFSAGLLFFSAQLLFLTGTAERRAGRPWGGWMGLSAVFAFLTVDELSAFHEKIGWAVGDRVGAEGLLHEYFWVWVYGPIVVLLGLVYLRFLGRMPRRVRWTMILAAVLYVGGSVGVEVLGSPFWNDDPELRRWPYLALVGVEEMLEMFGISVFIRAILLYQAHMGLVISVRDGEDTAEAPGIPAAADMPG
ncbi:MAG: hypothetical protein P8188_08600 [Gemmatimonadota bacterium]|jgi:hypothetical protein